MEDDINKRLRLILEKEELTSSQFAKMVGYGASSVSHILSGRNKPGFDFIQEILKKFDDLSPDWLMLGKGDMYKSERKYTYEDSAGYEKELETGATVRSEPEAPYLSNAGIKTDGKSIARIIVFYSDKTFTEYKPSN